MTATTPPRPTSTSALLFETRLGGVPVRVERGFFMGVVVWGICPSAAVLTQSFPTLTVSLLAILSIPFVLGLAVLVHQLGYLVAGRRYGIEIFELRLTAKGGGRFEPVAPRPPDPVGFALSGPLASVAAVGLVAAVPLAMGWTPGVLPAASDPFSTSDVGLPQMVLALSLVANGFLIAVSLVPMPGTVGGWLLTEVLLRRGRDLRSSTRVVLAAGAAVGVAMVAVAAWLFVRGHPLAACATLSLIATSRVPLRRGSAAPAASVQGDERRLGDLVRGPQRAAVPYARVAACERS
jgi:hypothetical protein